MKIGKFDIGSNNGWILFFSALFAIISLFISSNKSMWRDEAFSYLTALNSPSEIVNISINDFNPPLYYFLLKMWVVVSSNVVWMRSQTLIFAILTIYILNKLTSELVSNSIPAWWRALFLTSSVNILYFSAELRGYILVMLAITVSIYCLIRWLETMRAKAFGVVQIKWSLALLAAQLAMLYAHNLSIIWVFSFNLSLFFFLIYSRKWRELKVFLLVMIALAVCYFPWLLVFIDQSKRQSVNFWLTFDPIKSLDEYMGLFFFSEGIISDMSYYKRLYLFFKSLYLTGLLLIVIKLIGKYYQKFKLKTRLCENKMSTYNTGVIFILSLSLIITNLFFYVYSKYNSPILYWRYLALFTPAVILMTYSVYSIVWELNKKLVFLILTVQLILSSFVLRDVLFSPSKTEYKKLADLNGIIITREGLDIQPCMYYNKCVYLGDFKLEDKYNGSAQLKIIPTIEDIRSIQENAIYYLYRSVNNRDLMDLQVAGFVKNEEFSLGDGVNVMKFVR